MLYSAFQIGLALCSLIAVSLFKKGRVNQSFVAGIKSENTINLGPSQKNSNENLSSKIMACVKETEAAVIL